jgi:diaminopimelate decarboxylase
MLYNAVYDALIAGKADAPAAAKVTVAGKHCESGDLLIEEAIIPEPEIGDILVTPATGAYGYVMANNYNRVPRPAVVMVKDGTAREIIRRETYEDLVRLEEQ